MPGSAQGIRCLCNRRLRGAQHAYHDMICESLSGSRSMRHDYLIRYDAKLLAVASAVEPSLRAMQMQPGARRHAKERNGARGDAILAMPDGLLVLDVKIVYAPAQTYLTGTPAFGSSAEVDGATARLGEDLKDTEYRIDGDAGACTHTPVVMESGGGLGKRAMGVLNQLATIAAELDGVDKRAFMRRTLQALSVSRVIGNGWMWNCRA